jgi:hypothetical protein
MSTRADVTTGVELHFQYAQDGYIMSDDTYGDCSRIGVSGPTRRAEVRRDGHCE